MKYFVLLCLSLAIVSAIPNQGRINVELDEEWEAYKTTFRKQYDSQYEYIRRVIWEANLKYIQKHNMEFDMGKHTFTLGLNEFADLTNEEFRARYLSTPRPNNPLIGATYMPPLNGGDLPDTVDWRTKGYVTPVKNQGQCGSCWSFSTTGSLEGQYFRKTGTLLSFSEQQLVDCSTSYGNQGCNGGLMDQAFNYIKDKGIELESDYPYTARDGKCNYDASKVQTKLASFTDIPTGNESALQDAVANVGPVSVAIDASHISFQLYRNGVYNAWLCSSTRLDHGVLAVGYGVYNGEDYWLVKNSWGPSWGLDGYIMMSRNKKNQCGIATAASYPQL